MHCTVLCYTVLNCNTVLYCVPRCRSPGSPHCDHLALLASRRGSRRQRDSATTPTATPRYCTVLYCTVLHCTVLYAHAQVAAAEDFQLSGTARNGTAALLTARSVFVKLISISGNVQCLIRMFHYWSRAEQRYPARAAVPDHDKKRRIASLPEQVKGAAVLYCTVLYCTVLYCSVLYCTVLYCTAV